MKTTISKLFAVALCLMTLGASAQQVRSTYFLERTPFRYTMNPALMPDYGFLALPGLGGVNFSTQSNFGMKDFLYPSKTNSNELVTFMSPQVDAKKFLRGLNKQNRIGAKVDVNILSFGFFGKKGSFNAVEIGLKVPQAGAYIPRDLFAFAKDLGNPSQTEPYDISNMRVRASAYLDLGYTHSRRINDRLTVGAKLKFLLGVADIDANINNMQVRIGDDRIYAKASGKANFSIPKWIKFGKDKDGNISISDFDIDSDKILSSPLGGFGAGIDLGATYRLLDKLTLSAAIIDLGFISWNNNTVCQTPIAEYEFKGFEDLTADNAFSDEMDRLESIFEKVTEFIPTAEAQTRTTMLNATLNFGAEYKLFKQLSFGLLNSTHFDRDLVWNELMLAINVRPVKWINLSFTGSVSDYGTSWGGALAISPGGCTLYIATDYMIGRVSKPYPISSGFNLPLPLNHMNLNCNFGLVFPLGKNPALKKPVSRML